MKEADRERPFSLFARSDPPRRPTSPLFDKTCAPRQPCKSKWQTEAFPTCAGVIQERGGLGDLDRRKFLIASLLREVAEGRMNKAALCDALAGLHEQSKEEKEGGREGGREGGKDDHSLMARIQA
ncbi:hypothetical protein Naga_101361g2, partial [Nannochloropsis gaditana]